MKTKIINLAKEKLPMFTIVDVEENGGESGAEYGSIIITKGKHYSDGFIFRTGYCFFIPNNLSLTSSVKEIEERYLLAAQKFYGSKKENSIGGSTT